VFTKIDASELSLDNLTSEFKDITGFCITKQSFDARFNPKSIEFMKKLLNRLLKTILNTDNNKIEFLNSFERVLIKDSTCFQLPENLFEFYPGPGGKSSKANIRIQFEYDYKTGEVTDLTIQAYNIQDQTDAKNTIFKVCENDLIIRDLGYIAIPVLLAINEKQAFYVNRYNFGTKAYEKNKKKNCKCKKRSEK